MASTRIKVQQYDNNIRLIFNIKKDGLVESLTGATVVLKFKHTQKEVFMIRNCEITDAQNGECMYVLKTEDLMVEGGFISEIEVSYANETKLSCDNPIMLIVSPEVIKNGVEVRHVI